jgi:pimeloyl-ACP methyl ester carboxylesterase
MHVTDVGSGPPLLLLAANGHDSRDYAAVIPALSRDHRVIAVDWPGFGRSPAPQPPGSATVGALATGLAALVERLDLSPAHLVGNSVGGYAAARLAIEAPHRVRSLVLVSPAGFRALTAGDRLFIRAEIVRCLPDARTAAFDTGHVPFAEDPEAFLAEVRPFFEALERDDSEKAG